MNIKKYLIKKLINKKILEELIHDNPDLTQTIINDNFDYYMHKYFSRSHVNCRCNYTVFEEKE